MTPPVEALVDALAVSACEGTVVVMDSAMNRLFGARDMIKTLEAERSAVLDSLASPELRAELSRIESLLAAANAVLAQALIEAGEELHHLKVREYSHELETPAGPEPA